ncbi:MAG: flagellar motor switch protein FliN [Chloroflexi bacterium]|nr:flagellar motor switch protein FliN [Chloroflexota bacterium]
MEDDQQQPTEAEPAAAESSGRGSRGASVRVSPVEFGTLDEAPASGPLGTMELLLDVRVRLSVQLGRAQLSIREVLGLGPGSVVELDKPSNEPVDILVNERLIAHGEVVVVDENFGIRVLDIVSPQARIGSESIT